MFNIKKKMANYVHNYKHYDALATQKYSPFDKDNNYIEHQPYMSILRYGCKTMDYNGCGPIAVYNLFKLCNLKKTFCEISYDLESGLLLNGFLGTSILYMKKYIGKFLKCCMSFTRHKISDKGIMYYFWFRNWRIGAHYVTYEYMTTEHGERIYKIHNAPSWCTKISYENDQYHYEPYIGSIKAYRKQTYQILSIYLNIEDGDK